LSSVLVVFEFCVITGYWQISGPIVVDIPPKWCGIYARPAPISTAFDGVIAGRLRVRGHGSRVEHYAGQNQFNLHLAVTYVPVAEARIVGFATVAASSVERASVPSARLRKRLAAYPLPVLRLARLGVDM
jgi:hypothetical protein